MSVPGLARLNSPLASALIIHPDLPRPHGNEALMRDAQVSQSGCKILWWLIDALVCEPKSSPMKPKGGSGFENTERANRFFGVHVLGSHEPAGLIGADRQEGDIQTAMTGRDVMKVPAAGEARIACKVNGTTCTAQNEGCPERMISIVGGPSRPMMGWLGESQNTGCEFDAVAPIQTRYRDVRVLCADDGVIPERSQNSWLVAFPETHKSWDIQVIVVVMRDQHRIDAGQVIERNAGRVVSSRPCKRHRAGAL